MANLEKAIGDLLGRLEQVTNRLESVEKQLAGGGAPAGGSSHAAAPAAAAGDDPEWLAEFDELVSTHLKDFDKHSAAIGPEVGAQATNFVKAVAALRNVLVAVARSAEPPAAVLADLVKPIGDLSQAASKTREDNRKSKFWEHISAVSEGAVGALLWPVAPKPVPHLNEYKGQSEFWSNKILVSSKGKEDDASKANLQFVAQLNGFLKELIPFVKKYHTTKPAWNAKGGDAKAFVGGAPAGGPPPPPAGGPPPPPAASAPAPAKKPAADPSQLFAELNKGGAITSGLKKVTADMQTHKNPNLRAGAVVPAGDGAPKKKSSSSSSSSSAKKVKDPVFTLDGNKWRIEHQINQAELVIPADKIETKHTVYIFGCEKTNIHIPSKLNAVVVDGCKKSSVVFGDVVSGVEIVNCNGLELQCSGRSPNWAVDKSSTVSVYLSNAAGLETEFITSKSDSTNILVPGVNEGDDMIELPVPEQYRTVVKVLPGNKKELITEHVQHAG